MLEEAGFQPRRARFDVDDDSLVEAVGGVDAACLARAWFKACAAVSALSRIAGSEGRSVSEGVVLAADTLCASEGRLIGKPGDDREAMAMIGELAGRTHRTVTGVAIIDLRDDSRSIWSDATVVRIGPLDDDTIKDYVASGEWKGKSGGYNLADRIAAGWTIEVDGDPSTVMGLPMRKLEPQLRGLLEGGGSA